MSETAHKVPTVHFEHGKVKVTFFLFGEERSKAFNRARRRDLKIVDRCPLCRQTILVADHVVLFTSTDGVPARTLHRKCYGHFGDAVLAYEALVQSWRDAQEHRHWFSHLE